MYRDLKELATCQTFANRLIRLVLDALGSHIRTPLKSALLLHFISANPAGRCDTIKHTVMAENTGVTCVKAEADHVAE